VRWGFSFRLNLVGVKERTKSHRRPAENTGGDGEDEARKRRGETKKNVSLFSLLTRGLEIPFVIGHRNPILRIDNCNFL